MLFGAGSFAVDLLRILHLLSRSGAPPAGLILGPVFAAVGYSLLCPLLTPPQTRNARRRGPIKYMNTPD